MARANVNGSKQIRTKFTQYQKKEMLEFSERVGCKLQKRDEELISDFCSKIRVKNGFLSIKESTKMSILSKIWLQAWSTLPNLKFIGNYSIDRKIIDAILERYRDNKIPIDKFEFSYCLEYGSRELPFFTILATKSLRELVLADCDLASILLSSGVANCHSLRKLSLSCVTLDENMLQNLLNSCPLLVALVLEYCPGLKKIELLNLRKIKNRSLEVLYIRDCEGIREIDAPNLVSLDYNGDQAPELKIAKEPI
ncbi:putative F-box/LRR-repeat protein At3g18150 [Nicotiana tabacum]|uniref:F-box/LRR-repeat protein At3g18150 n=1 Tax=Nicotiana tabacum TaxID=4097 RepID=A0AC58UNW4_TOBAC